MTKKSKSRNKVTTTSTAATSESIDKQEDNKTTTSTTSPTNKTPLSLPLSLPAIPPSVVYSTAPSFPSPRNHLKNGCGGGGVSLDSRTTRLTNTTTTNSYSPLSTSSLASIPGIVDDFLAPKFVKVLRLSDHGYEKTPPPDLDDLRRNSSKTDGNANKLSTTTTSTSSTKKKDKKESKEESPPSPSSPPPPDQPPPPPPLPTSTAPKKNKRKKSKPVKHTTNDSEDYGQELVDLSSSARNGGSPRFPTGLSTKDVSSLAQLQRIRSSAFHYEGNNIVLVGGENDEEENAQFSNQRSCYDDYNYEYEHEDPSLVDQDDIEEEDDGGREGSWSVPVTGAHSHHQLIDYNSYPKASSSLASSMSAESENASLSSTTTNNNNYSGANTATAGPSSSSTSSSCYPALTTCHSIWDGMNNPCEIKDCVNLANKKCSQCKTVFYCTEDHQRLDWKKHKNECIPYRMESRFGDDVSVAVASRHIPAGQKIFSDKPLLVLPVADPDNDFVNVMDVPCVRNRVKCTADLNSLEEDSSRNEPVICTANQPACFGCLKSVEFIGPPRYKCSRCQLPLCSYKCHLDTIHQATECQAVSCSGEWKEDQYFCYHLMYLDIEIVRALQLEALDTSQWERFMQMKQNLRVESYKASVRYQRFIENYRELVPISAKLSGYNDDLIGNVHAIITALSFRPALKSTYKLLFTTQILFGHDCIPNTFHYLEESPNGKVNGMTLVTKASMPICKREIITIDFSPTPYLYYPLRRMILRNILSIDNCRCKRCHNPTMIDDHTGDIRCPRCRYGLICPEKAFKWTNSVWACTTCLEEYPYKMVDEITKECRDELAQLLNQPRHMIVPGIQQFISRRENDLHPGHSIIIQAWSFIETYLRTSLTATRLAGPGPRYPENTIEEYRLLGRCGTATEEHLKIIRPGICLERGSILLNRYYMEIAVSAKRFNLRVTKRKEYIQELFQCIKLLQEALKIFQMYEGFNREVAHNIQEATSALVTLKSFIQEQMVTDNEESKQRKAMQMASVATAMSATFRDNL